MIASERTMADSDFFGAVHSWQEGDVRVCMVTAADGRVARWEKVLPDGRWRGQVPAPNRVAPARMAPGTVPPAPRRD